MYENMSNLLCMSMRSHKNSVTGHKMYWEKILLSIMATKCIGSLGGCTNLHHIHYQSGATPEVQCQIY